MVEVTENSFAGGVVKCKYLDFITLLTLFFIPVHTFIHEKYLP